MKATPKFPEDGAELRRRVLTEYDTLATSGAAMALLDAACEALDERRAASELLSSEGLTVAGSRGPRTHPAVKIRHDAHMRLIATLRLLNLEF